MDFKNIKTSEMSRLSEKIGNQMYAELMRSLGVDSSPESIMLSLNSISMCLMVWILNNIKEEAYDSTLQEIFLKIKSNMLINKELNNEH